MNGQLVSMVALLGWLILAGSALASFKLSWRRGVSYALVWLSLFGALAWLIAVFGS